MPSPATTNKGTKGGTAAQTGASDQGAARPTVPFIRATRLYREQFSDVTRTMTTSDQDLGTVDVPAYGYMRSILVQVEASGTADGAETTDPDFPWSALNGLFLTEPNGAVIAQFNDGYQAYLVNKYGGYRYGSNPENSPVFDNTDGANYSFLLRIPVELNGRDGLGALPNQNSAANFKVRAILSGSNRVTDTTPTNQPSVRIRMFLEAYDQPESENAGRMNQTTPPAMNTTQFWSVQSYNVNSGEQSVRLTRVGNYIRNLLFVYRDSGGDRLSSDWPDPATLYLDTRPMDRVSNAVWTDQVFERYGYEDLDQDDGVWPYDFCHEFDGRVGWENRDLWLPTLGSTRLELQGNFGSAGTLYILTNDVTTAGNVFL